MLLKIVKSLTISPKLCLLSVLTDGVNIQLTCISWYSIDFFSFVYLVLQGLYSNQSFPFALTLFTGPEVILWEIHKLQLWGGLSLKILNTAAKMQLVSLNPILCRSAASLTFHSPLTLVFECTDGVSSSRDRICVLQSWWSFSMTSRMYKIDAQLVQIVLFTFSFTQKRLGLPISFKSRPPSACRGSAQKEARCQHTPLLPPSLALPSNHGAAHLLFKTHCATVQLERRETLGCWFLRPVSCLALCYLLCSSTGICQTPLSTSIKALIWPRSIKERDNVVGISWINELNQG